jgi:hypothetical protein
MKLTTWPHPFRKKGTCLSKKRVKNNTKCNLLIFQRVRRFFLNPNLWYTLLQELLTDDAWKCEGSATAVCICVTSVERAVVNLTNIIRATFEPIFSCQNNYKAKLYAEKSCAKHFRTKKQLLGEIDTSSQFHKHIKHSFFVRKCFTQLFSSYVLTL